jgi:hypothetical protein
MFPTRKQNMETQHERDLDIFWTLAGEPLLIAIFKNAKRAASTGFAAAPDFYKNGLEQTEFFWLPEGRKHRLYLGG